jgi:hypothetical protein
MEITADAPSSLSPTPATFSSALPVRKLARCASMLATMAAASKGSPSWKVTPSRGVSVHSVKSSFASIDSRRNGTTWPSWSNTVSGS